MGNEELKNLPRSELKALLRGLPLKPGVYLFKDSRGEVLYVGKAKNLRSRVRSYFQNGKDLQTRTLIMKQNIADLDYTVVSSEIESLILENNLIKQYQPRFNVRMRDDKNYQFIKIDYGFEIPQVYPVRKIEKNSPPTPLFNKEGWGEFKSKFFGPYTSGLSVKNTLTLLNRVFHLCRNKKTSAKPCFAYHLGRCPGVCAGLISLAEYQKTFKQIEQFLKHRQTDVLKDLKKQMKKAAGTRRFEKAATFRDRIRSLEHLWEKQKIVSTKNESHDYLGFYATATEAIINVFVVRGGKLIHTEYFQLEHQNSLPEEILEKFILQYYPESSDLPKMIFVPVKLPNKTLVEKALQKIAGRKTKIHLPWRGNNQGLINLATQNAELYHERELTSFAAPFGRAAPNFVGREKILAQLQTILNLPSLPKRIEGFDISNIQGTNPVGSMAVFTDGQPDKTQYRKFKINILETPDDFAMMREILERRLRRLSTSPALSGTLPSQGEGKKEDDIWPRPDLIVIDGGKGQLNVAVKVLKNYNLNIPVIGLAKRLEEIFLPGKKTPLILPPSSPVLFLLQRVRDEAHRFAITFYRGHHEKQTARSRLDDIPGVGPVTRKKLLQKFGTVSAIKNASLEAIAREVGTKTAKKIKEQL